VQQLTPLALILVGAAGLVTRVCVAAGEPACGGDFPAPMEQVDYRQEFAAGTLLPDDISLNAQRIKLGMTPGALIAVLGEPTREIEAPERRSAREQCQYLLRLLQKHPTSMQMYALVPLRLRNMSGVFRVSEWELPNIGTIKSFWYKAEQSGRELSYLYYFSPVSIALTKVERLNGEHLTLVRAGPPRVEWNIERNRVSIAELPQ
jgi:hypothetical protein